MNPNWTTWPLIAASVLLLLLLGRVDLLVIVAPLAVVVGYAASARNKAPLSRQRKI